MKLRASYDKLILILWSLKLLLLLGFLHIIPLKLQGFNCSVVKILWILMVPRVYLQKSSVRCDLLDEIALGFCGFHDLLFALIIELLVDFDAFWHGLHMGIFLTFFTVIFCTFAHQACRECSWLFLHRFWTPFPS